MLRARYPQNFSSGVFGSQRSVGSLELMDNLFSGTQDWSSLDVVMSTDSIGSVEFVTRASQFLAELLVVGITWWYTYQSYRIRQGVELGKTVSSLLLYNGESRHVFVLPAEIYRLDMGMCRKHLFHVGCTLKFVTFLNHET